MKKIIVAYWYGDFEYETGISHNSEFQYTEEKRNEIINTALDNNLQVMLVKGTGALIIYIDNGRFRQR